jgi:hypothetical protein
MFANKLVTDGSTLIVHFARRKREGVQMVDLTLDDFSADEIDTYLRPCALDPGINNAFTASYGHGEQEHMLLSLTSKEYYTKLKNPPEEARLKARKDACGISRIESNMPSAKTSSIDTYKVHVRYLLQNLRTLFTFYGPEQGKSKWFRLKRKQSVLMDCVNILVDGGTKYNKEKRDSRKTRRNRKRRKKARQERMER